MGAVSTRKKSNAGKNVFVFFLVFIILEMLLIFGIGKVFKNEDVTPSIAGYSIYMTKDDLMSRSDNGSYQVTVPKNVLVIASEGLTNANSKIGSAVLCENVKGVGTGLFWLAEVNTEDGVDGVTYVVTNGDKSYTIERDNVVGITSSYYQSAGKFITFVTSTFGMIVCAVVPLFLLVLIELIIAIATHTPEEDDDEDDEDERVERPVELDDFLFGGQSEGEQIAKHLHKETEEDKPVQIPDIKVEPAKIVEDEPIAIRNVVPEEPAKTEITGDSLTLKDDDKMSRYYDKATRLIDGEEGAPAPVRPTNRPAGARRPRRRTTVSSASASANASLEDLMKMMEEEQNKLRNQVK